MTQTILHDAHWWEIWCNYKRERERKKNVLIGKRCEFFNAQSVATLLYTTIDAYVAVIKQRAYRIL